MAGDWRDDNPHHIGRFVQQMRKALITVPHDDDIEAVTQMVMMLQDGEIPIVDITSVREQTLDMTLDLYEDLGDIHPVWPMSLMVARNKHGNIYGTMCMFLDAHDDGNPETKVATVWESYDIVTGEPVNTGDWWSRVRKVLVLGVYNGGRSDGQPVCITGPVAWFRIALDEQGNPIDINHMYPGNITVTGDDRVRDAGVATLRDLMLNIAITCVRAYMIAGASNVELVEATYPRRIQKRLERTGTRLQTIVIKRTGKTYQHKAGQKLGGDIPQEFVRGHFAKYGIDGRGKLFGKYTGKFWIPGHVRGSIESDKEREVDYRVEA